MNKLFSGDCVLGILPCLSTQNLPWPWLATSTVVETLMITAKVSPCLAAKGREKADDLNIVHIAVQVSF